MERDQATATTAGVFVECVDAHGFLLGQAVYFDWCGQPVPAVGDTLQCTLRAPSGAEQTVVGRVRARHFDVQRADDGTPAVWVRVVLTPASTRAATTVPHPRHRAVRFSRN